MPKVSVVMSVYNGEKYLKEAIDSILNQTFKGFEFIIINDGSTDKTRKILEFYTDPRIRLINQANMGLAKSLNRGLKIARGEYIARMDADDISLPERLEKEVKLLDNHKDVGLVGIFPMKMDESGRNVGLYKTKTKNEDLREVLWRGDLLCHGSVMFRKECVDKVGFYRKKLKFAEDYDLWFRIAEFFGITNIEEPLYKYRINPDSISLTNLFGQSRYCSLVRMLAKERRRCRRDRLEDLKEEDINRILDTILPATKRNKKKALASGYLYLAEVSYCAGNYTKSKEWLLKSLNLNLFTKRAWVLVFKLLICWKLPLKLIKKLKSVKSMK